MYETLDLFSGIGGFSLGLGWAGFTTVAFCEYDEKAQLVLKKHWTDIPIFPNIRHLTYEGLKAYEIKTIDVICGGFPCQPFSTAGKQRGTEDDRYLWPEMFRLIKEIRPTWVIGENVAGIIKMALDTVLSDLESIGYSTRPFNIPACAVGAPHQRKRIWIIAHTNHSTRSTEQKRKREECSQKPLRCSEDGMESGRYVSNPTSWPQRRRRISVLRENIQTSRERTSSTTTGLCKAIPDSNKQHGNNGGLGASQVCGERSEETKIQRHTNWWKVESDVGRVVDGFPGRMDRLRQLGNAVVPQIPFLIGKAIIESENNIDKLML